MAGTVVGSIDHQIGDGVLDPPDLNQNLFKVLYDFFAVTMAGAGYCTLIALNWGSAGTGTDFHDGANPFTEGAFAVFRMNGTADGNAASSRTLSYYVLIQWYDATNWEAIAPRGPGLLAASSASDGTGIMLAFREDGGSPWNGTTNVDGLDAKGTPVWTAGPSTLHVLHAANAFSGGASFTDKEDLVRAFFDANNANSIHRVHMLGDADSFVLLHDFNDDGDLGVKFMGVYEPLADATPPMPLIVASQQSTNWPWTTSAATPFGGVLAGSDNLAGLCLPTDITQGPSPWTPGFETEAVADTASMPSALISPAAVYGVPITVNVTAVGRGQVSGLIGYLPQNLIDLTFGAADKDTNAALTRAFFGPTAAAALHISVPWDGATTPGSTVTRAGVQF